MLSFFGDHDQKHPSKGPVVSKVQVRKPSRPANATTSSTTKPGAVLSSVPRSFISKPVASGSPSLHANGNGTKRLDSKKPSHSPVPSHISTPTKRKTPTPSRIQSESPSESSPSDSSDDASKFGSKSKRRKVQTNGSGTPAIEENVQNDHVRNGIWGWEEVDERGEWGRGWSGFVGCEEVMRGVRKGWAGGGEVRKGELDKYVACEC
jgi:H3 lysine-79-specific histone-lysine N-methyltransferase